MMTNFIKNVNVEDIKNYKMSEIFGDTCDIRLSFDVKGEKYYIDRTGVFTGFYSDVLLDGSFCEMKAEDLEMSLEDFYDKLEDDKEFCECVNKEYSERLIDFLYDSDDFNGFIDTIIEEYLEDVCIEHVNANITFLA